MSAEEFQRRRMTALPLLIFAGIDLVIALFLLLGSGFSVGFWMIALIGCALAAIGLVRLYRQPRE